ncbi:lupus La protein homolog B-like [Tubulanus polymorphus]|uniref:lupus La protein homolog B-like n=1 Tax=Tubulanus polymorphus TaxID=672921 RepID=UPI003DA52C42
MADSTTPDVVEEVKTESTTVKNEAESTTVKDEKAPESNGNGVSCGDEEPTELETKIIRQVEHYFGDMNLGRDRFMQEQLKLDDGWIPLETMIKFKRLKELTEDFATIVKALRKSKSGLIAIGDDELKIRRSAEKPIPVLNVARKEDVKQRSLYVKGFELDTTIDDLLSFFDAHGPPEYIQMRRDESRAFKGSCFVVFKSVDDAKTFHDLETIKYKDVELQRLFKDAYFKKKREKKKVEVLEGAKKLEEDKQKQLEENKKKHMEQLVKGTVLHLTGMKDGVKREDIKELFKDSGEIAWVDFDMGDDEAFVRFVDENEASKAWKAALNTDEKLMLNDAELTANVLEGDAEVKHWESVFTKKTTGQQKNFGKKRGGFRGRGGGGPPKKRSRRN